MKRIVALIGLGVVAVLASTWAGSSGPPVGTWEVKRPDGFAFFTFEDGGTVTGYGGGPRSFGLFNATGSWATVDGIITGSLVDLGAGVSSPFKGKATATRLRLHITVISDSILLKGKPLSALPDPTGHWIGTSKHSGTVSNETVDIAATAQPGVFDVTGSSAGQLLLGTKSKGFAYITGSAGPVSLAGKFDTLDGTAKLSGIDTNRAAVNVNLTRP